MKISVSLHLSDFGCERIRICILIFNPSFDKAGMKLTLLASLDILLATIREKDGGKMSPMQYGEFKRFQIL